MEKTLGERLKAFRLAKGYSQADVAQHLNISRQSVSRWENNTSYPDLDNLKILSELYGISMDEMFKETKELQTQINQKTKKIDQTIEQIETKQEKLKTLNEQLLNDKDEGLLLLIVAAVSAFTFPLGFVIAPFVIYRNKKTNTLYKLVYFVSICSIFFNISGAYGHLANIFNWGETSVTYIEED